MQEKTITITIDERGNSTLDLEGFAGQGCENRVNLFKPPSAISLRYL
jgi:hypothetical protein